LHDGASLVIKIKHNITATKMRDRLCNVLMLNNHDFAETVTIGGYSTSSLTWSSHVRTLLVGTSKGWVHQIIHTCIHESSEIARGESSICLCSDDNTVLRPRIPMDISSACARTIPKCFKVNEGVVTKRRGWETAWQQTWRFCWARCGSARWP